MEWKPHLEFKLWIYNLRTNLHFTLKEWSSCAEKASEILAQDSRRYNRHQGKESERFKSFA